VPLTIDVAIAKTHRYGTRESGDTAEVIERPAGGFSVVLVDGQGTGAAAKLLSLQVAGQVVSLLNAGVRDGAAARAAHDYLFATRGGKVSAELCILSVDLASRSLVITRNSTVPVVLWRDGVIALVDDQSERIGIYRHTRPHVFELPMEAETRVVIVSDGVVHAGERWSCPFTLPAAVEAVFAAGMTAELAADELLRQAIAADRGRPNDDMTVVVLWLAAGGAAQPIRKLHLTVPLPQ
jgi:serine phosphatase RsbU (regulator of sigma subunit)